MFKVGDIVIAKPLDTVNFPEYRGENIFGKIWKVTDVGGRGTFISIREVGKVKWIHWILAKRFQLSNGIIHLLSQEELNRIKNLNT